VSHQVFPSARLPAALPGLSDFAVDIHPPDLARWRQRHGQEGGGEIEGVLSFHAAEPGLHVALVALTHGNEIAGAIVLDRLLRQGLRPSCGRLTLIFANLAAFDRFDMAQPTASRFVDEDMNRVWSTAVLDGPRHSTELARARALRPLIDDVDMLLDLHSMLWPATPLMLSGLTRQGRALASAIGQPGLIVADAGHSSGRRLMDYRQFADPDAPQAANLLEAGQHWQLNTVAITEQATRAFLIATGCCPDLEKPVRPPQLIAEVTHTITAATSSFAFVTSFEGGQRIPERNTLLALDGTAEIRTPYDDCLLVMPSLRPTRGHTAVRLARFETTAV